MSDGIHVKCSGALTDAVPTWKDVNSVLGSLDGSGLKVGIVISRFNTSLTGMLASKVIGTLQELGVAATDIHCVWVPGAYEIPLIAKQFAKEDTLDAIIALGVVIEGETPHANLINSEVCHALAEIAREHSVPVIDGVVTARNLQQAEVRCSDSDKGRGRYVAEAAIEMAQVLKQLGRSS